MFMLFELVALERAEEVRALHEDDVALLQDHVGRARGSAAARP
jgi:hypothetical protein